MYIYKFVYNVSLFIINIRCDHFHGNTYRVIIGALLFIEIKT